ncbi:MAG: hypothetical protein IKA50_06380 [Clostridia bacterium]|nr:hypothetical protein [Clostridia bacterium]
MKRARKLLAFVLAMVMLWVLTACGGSQPNNSLSGNKANDDKQNESQQEVFDEQKVLSQLDVKEYRTPVDGYPHYAGRSLVYLVKNNSQFNVKMTFKITTYNTNNEVIQIFHEELSSVAKETEKVLQITNLEEYETCRYELQVEESNKASNTHNDVEYELIKTKEKVLLTVTNNSDGDVPGGRRMIHAYMLCFHDGKMLDCHSFFYYLKETQSDTQEWNVNFDERYDSYKVVVF